MSDEKYDRFFVKPWRKYIDAFTPDGRPYPPEFFERRLARKKPKEALKEPKPNQPPPDAKDRY